MTTPQPTIEQELGFFEKVTASFIVHEHPEYSLSTLLAEISKNKTLRNEFAKYVNKAADQCRQLGIHEAIEFYDVKIAQAIQAERERCISIIDDVYDYGIAREKLLEALKEKNA